jgi:putative transposase
MKDKDYSQRRACVLVGLQTKTYRYVSKRPDDAPIRQRLRADPRRLDS